MPEEATYPAEHGPIYSGKSATQECPLVLKVKSGESFAHDPYRNPEAFEHLLGSTEWLGRCAADT